MDGSKKSLKGLEFAFKLKGEHDKIHIVHISESQELKDRVQNQLKGFS